MRRNSAGRLAVAALADSALALALTTTLLVACASSLAAQSKKEGNSNVRMLQGTVLDDGGHPVEQAVVQLKDSRTLQVLSFITKEDGAYHFADLKNDIEYDVKASHGGLSTDWKRISVFDARKVLIVNLKLEKK